MYNSNTIVLLGATYGYRFERREAVIKHIGKFRDEIHNKYKIRTRFQESVIDSFGIIDFPIPVVLKSILSLFIFLICIF